MEQLRNFNIFRLAVDATAVGSPIADRFMANLDFEVIPYVFSTPSKSAMYKHLDAEFKGGRFSYPNSESAKETKEHKKFKQQFTDLQKGYSGQHMVVSHPAERGAHDDYCDSTALAVWAAKGAGVDKPVTEKNPFIGVRKEKSVFINSRNRLTARRR